MTTISDRPDHIQVKPPSDLAHPTASIRRRGGAAALLTAPWLIVLGIGCYVWATRNGGDDLTGAHALALAADHPTLLRVATVSTMLACLVLVPALLGAMRLLRSTAPKLSLIAGTIMIAGYGAYFGIVASGFDVVAMAEQGLHRADYAAAIDAAEGDVYSVWIFALFVVGNLLGTALLAVAMFRSRQVPRWAAACVGAWPVLHVSGLLAGSEWFELGGASLQAVGFAVLAVAILRMSDREWDPAPVAQSVPSV